MNTSNKGVNSSYLTNILSIKALTSKMCIALYVLILTLESVHSSESSCYCVGNAFQSLRYSTSPQRPFKTTYAPKQEPACTQTEAVWVQKAAKHYNHCLAAFSGTHMSCSTCSSVLRDWDFSSDTACSDPGHPCFPSPELGSLTGFIK